MMTSSFLSANLGDLRLQETLPAFMELTAFRSSSYLLACDDSRSRINLVLRDVRLFRFGLLIAVGVGLLMPKSAFVDSILFEVMESNALEFRRRRCYED